MKRFSTILTAITLTTLITIPTAHAQSSRSIELILDASGFILGIFLVLWIPGESMS